MNIYKCMYIRYTHKTYQDIRSQLQNIPTTKHSSYKMVEASKYLKYKTSQASKFMKHINAPTTKCCIQNVPAVNVLSLKTSQATRKKDICNKKVHFPVCGKLFFKRKFHRKSTEK